MVADLGCLGCAFKSGKYSSPFCMQSCRAGCTWRRIQSVRQNSFAAKTRAAHFSSKRRGRPVRPAGPGPAIWGRGGVAPASDRVLPALRSPALFRAFGCSFCRLPFRPGEVGSEISSETPWACTFPRSFHQGLRMTLEQGHLTVHGREDKRHRLGPAKCLVLLADLIEAQLAGPPFLVEVRDARVVEFELCISVSDEISG